MYFTGYLGLAPRQVRGWPTPVTFTVVCPTHPPAAELRPLSPRSLLPCLLHLCVLVPRACNNERLTPSLRCLCPPSGHPSPGRPFQFLCCPQRTEGDPGHSETSVHYRRPTDCSFTPTHSPGCPTRTPGLLHSGKVQKASPPVSMRGNRTSMGI